MKYPILPSNMYVMVQQYKSWHYLYLLINLFRVLIYLFIESQCFVYLFTYLFAFVFTPVQVWGNNNGLDRIKKDEIRVAHGSARVDL